MLKHPIRWVVILALVAVVVFAWLRLGREHPVDVQVARVELGTVESTATNSSAGTVKARKRAGLSPEVSGVVKALHYRAGDTVPAGAVLVELAADTQAANLLQAQRTLDRARVAQEQAHLATERAHRELERNQGLAAQGLVTDDQLDELDSRHEQLAAAEAVQVAEHHLAEAGVALAEAELAKTRVIAPFAGVIAQLEVEIGEWITPAPPLIPAPPTLDLFDPASICIRAPMDEGDSAGIHRDQSVRVTVDSLRDRWLDGTVTYLAPFVLDVEEQNRTMEIEVDLADQDLARTLRPGTSADVEVVLERREKVLRIPSQALLQGRRVLVVDGERLVDRPVQTGIRNWQFTEITSGLKEGEEVVLTVDQTGVAAGALVEPHEEAAGRAGGASP